MNEYIPAGAGEKMQYIVHPFNDNTIRFVLRYPCRLQAEVMQQAALALARSVDVLHASFVTGPFGARWHIGDVTAEQVFRFIRVEKDPLDAALEQALLPVDAAAPAQIRCTLVHGARESALVLLVSHLCADGSDAIHLLQKLCEAYAMLAEKGSCGDLHVKNGSRDVEQVYAHLSHQDRRKLLRDPRTGVEGVLAFPSDEPGQPAVIRQSISAPAMAAVRERAHRLGATVNDVLLTACYYACAETAGVGAHTPISIMSMMNLRRHCPGGDSQGLCNLTGALTTVLPAGLMDTFTGTLSQITEQTRRSKEDPFAGLYGMPLLHGAAKKLPLGLLLAAASHLYGSMSLGMTNVGSIDCSRLQLEQTPPSEGWFGGPVKRKPGIQVSAASFGGACSLAIWGYAAPPDVPMLQQLLNRIAVHTSTFAEGGD